MKKIALYVGFLIILTFIIPAVLTISNEKVVEAKSNFNNSKNEQKSNEEGKNESETNDNSSESQINKEQVNDNEYSKYDYGKYTTIKVLHHTSNTIEEMNLDEYLYGVVSAEMPIEFELEALKAQAVVARTYTMYQIINGGNKHGDADVCDDSSCCQAWISKENRIEKWKQDNRNGDWNKIVTAVNETKGKIITYDGAPINAFFHSNSGGTTEAPINVWGGSGYPYLQAVATSGEDGYTQYSSEVELTCQEFINKMKEKYNDFTIDFSEPNCIEIQEYTTGGRVKTVKIGNHNISGVEARTIFGLKSANFIIEQENNTEKIKFKVIGYGHGVGMSQTGADSLAKQGYTYEDIIKHFYTGVELTNM